jgi:hypothetical protein
LVGAKNGLQDGARSACTANTYEVDDTDHDQDRKESLG